MDARAKASNYEGAYEQLSSLIHKGLVKQDKESGECFVQSIADEKQ